MIADFDKWLTDFKTGNREAVGILYEEFRPLFVHWMQQKHQCSEEDAIDLFQDSIIVLYKNAQAGKLDDLQSQLKTYLFRVGLNLFLKRLERNKRAKAAQELNVHKMDTVEMGIERQLDLEDRKKVIAGLLKQMQDPCQSILYLFYYHRYSMEAIQKIMKYRSLNVVRTQKRRCVKFLEKQLKKVWKKGEI